MDDCRPVPEVFAADATTFKSTGAQALLVQVAIRGGPGYKAFVPDDLQEEGQIYFSDVLCSFFILYVVRCDTVVAETTVVA